MDMMEDNERLLQNFFSEVASTPVADDGFTNRVMQRLPQRVNWFTHLWNIFCVTVFMVLFVVFRGWESLMAQFVVMMRTLMAYVMMPEPLNINLSVVLSVVCGLLLVAVIELMYSDKLKISDL
jgi:polyferredoxin